MRVASTTKFVDFELTCFLIFGCFPSVERNQRDLYNALKTETPNQLVMVRPNELVGVRAVSEGPLEGELELFFKHNCPPGTGCRSVQNAYESHVFRARTQKHTN